MKGLWKNCLGECHSPGVQWEAKGEEDPFVKGKGAEGGMGEIHRVSIVRTAQFSDVMVEDHARLEGAIQEKVKNRPPNPCGEN